MPIASSFIRHPSSFRRSRRGFTFAEVMFAVIIMGIGFIMVAAMFPVAIQQTRLTVDESTAAAVARGAAAMAEQVAGEHFEFNPPRPPPPNDAYAEGPLMVATDLLLEVDPTLPLAPPIGVAASAPSPPFPQMNPGDKYEVKGKVISFRDERVYNNRTSNDYPLRDEMWRRLQRGSLINQSDPRFAWVILYRRDRTYRDTRDLLNPVPAGPLPVENPAIVKDDAPAAQVIVIAVQSTQRPTFDGTDVTAPASLPDALVNLQPRPISVRIIDDSSPTNTTGVDLIQVRNSARLAGGTAAVAEGAFVVISDDQLLPTAPTDPNNGKLNGLIVRLGAQRGADTWELAPGYDFRAIDVDGPGPLPILRELPPGPSQYAEAYVVGRSLADPKDPAKGFAGPAMDVAAYSTFVRVKP